MWTVVQVGFILTVLLLVCIYVGKKIGERRISKVHEEMKALEKSFNQLLEQMELVSGHNLKVLETKTEELRDMLHAADKKCLYANDLLAEIETARRELQARLASQPATAGPGSFHEKKVRMEVQALLEEVQTKILLLERRLDELERASRVGLLRAVPEPVRAMAVGEIPSRTAAEPRRGPAPPPEDGMGAVSAVLASLVDRVSHLATTASPAAAAAPSAPRDGAAAGNGRPTSRPGLGGPAAGDKVVRFKPREESPPPLSPIPDLVADDEIPATANSYAADDDTAIPPPEAETVAPGPAPATASDPLPLRDGLPLPEPGTPFHDVLHLARQGVSIPQIARILNMGKGEVELIMNIYGARSQMRKVL